jgi:hypothetical protein
VIKVKVKFIAVLKLLFIKTCGGLDVKLYAFVTPVLGDEWAASRSGRFISQRKIPGIPWIAGRALPRGGLDVVTKKKYRLVPEIEPVTIHFTDRAVLL